MAVQIPDPGTGNGATGDNEYVFRSKVKSNFSDQTNAASRLVGSARNNVAAYEAEGLSDRGYGARCKFLPDGSDLNSIGEYTGFYRGNGVVNAPISGYVYAQHYVHSSSHQLQLIQEITNNFRMWGRSSSSAGWGNTVEFYHSGATVMYTTTTAAGANAVIDSSGKIMRSTSSERYKDIIADLELDDEAYKNAMKLAPIVYRSTADADNPDYHYYSFSAEALGAFDPAFTLWRETETVIDDEGNVTEKPLDERVAEGININALLAFSHAIAIKQDKMIKAQAEAIATLTQRINAMTAQ